MVAAATLSGTEELRRTNLRALLRAVHTRGPMTRAELTRLLGLNRSTIGGLTAALIDLGLVAERTAAGAASGGARSGRPSHLVVPRSENAVVAIDLGVERVQVALVGLGGTVLDRRVRAHARGEHDVRHVVERVAAMVEDMVAATPPRRFLGIAASIPGAVRLEDGMVQFAPNLGWHGEPFTQMLSHRLGRPVRAGNDANLGVLAEHLRGAALQRQHVIYLSASVGIGGGFLVDGRLLEGATGYAGEVGHLQVDASGPECRCGGIGCWELKVGENRLLALAGREAGGGPEAVAEVIAAADEGEDRARRAIQEVAEWTGIGLRSLINVFNPEVIVLGGSLAQLWETAAPVIEEILGRRALLAPRAAVAVRPAMLGQDSSLLGAAELAFEPVLDDPQCVAAS
ncbi:ROK family transcriptional regulator [Nocardioides sp. BP30]|uniref:ROK family transcriptional regulator n=1 Tax=Nocardioides sp. BP30 TaxID=3036374 RepID=UPI0024682EA8|nr:ROK family transcriptional regulator [Nocardioides sp. BP30]WGL50402.1 ROK family transcriptional regulator [Nocardioides sp. BP30]